MASVVLNKPPDDEVELAAELAYFFKEGGALPGAGGLFDQDYYHMMLIKAGLAALAEKEKRESKKAK
jgi:hypothetical protein